MKRKIIFTMEMEVSGASEQHIIEIALERKENFEEDFEGTCLESTKIKFEVK